MNRGLPRVSFTRCLKLIPRQIRRHVEAWHTRSGRSITISVHGHLLRAPIDHSYAPGNFASTQPLRNSALEVLGRAVGLKYPKASIVDIGANIGDSAAILSTSGCFLILVEPDPYFAGLLVRNIAILPDVRRVEAVAISSGEVFGEFARRRGTSRLREQPDGRAIVTKRMAAVCDDDTKLIKIDTDGWDYQIILDSLDFIREGQPILYFELECRSYEELEAALEVIRELGQLGYSFAAWDDSGLLVVGRSDVDAMSILAESLCHGTRASGQRLTVHGYDVLAVGSRDLGLLEEVVGEHRELQWSI